MKVVYMDASVEGGKQVVREKVATGKFILGEPSALVEHTQAMHASLKTFVNTDFSSYLRLSELDMEGINRLCSDSDAEDNQPEFSSYKVRPSSNPLSK
ncbi:unnamed protein product [Lactuca virosa]|uniref:Uncharacterized protein n=1 Tax=Lactuca virosa TaxID=75947 RepID=A0AAU9P502_9ASTR|nr:unnamed protein product [Lactuca virosa]